MKEIREMPFSKVYRLNIIYNELIGADDGDKD